MNPNSATEFYNGAPLESQDLWFRDPFIDQLWEMLLRQHVLITAPRRTGKTSVMNHLLDHPRHGFSVIYQNVQDLNHPADLFQTILDNFFDKHPDYIREMAKGGWKLLRDTWVSVFNKVESLGGGGFKMALRQTDPDWKTNWKKHGEELLREIRRMGKPVLLIVDELPDMILNMRKHDEALLRDFLAWFRIQRQTPVPSQDSVRWFVGGSVNLTATLDELGKVDSVNDLAVAPLPILTPDEVKEFVERMLREREIEFDATVAPRIEERLGRPIPLFLQMATQDLCRSWKLNPRRLMAADVDQVFDALVTNVAARDKLQHYHSRIDLYYREPRLTAAYELLGKLSQSGEDGLSRQALEQEFARVLEEMGQSMPSHARRRQFTQLMLDLDNDFYISEIAEDRYDFANGLMKAWWKKYYA